MSLLIESLENIFNWLEKNNPSVANSLQPGLSYEEIDEKVGNLPFCLPKEFYELYQWRNGNPEDSSRDWIEFFQCYRFMPLEESCQIILGMLEDNQLYIDDLFPYGWFPIFTFEGEYFGIIGSEKQRDYSPIVNIYEDETLTYTSLTAMMQEIAECYQTGTYYLNEDGYCEIEQAKANKISLKYNPDIILDRKREFYNHEEVEQPNNRNKKKKFFYTRRTTTERFYCDHDKHESQEIVAKKSLLEWEITRIERRYINNVLKKETTNTRIETKSGSLIYYFIVFVLCFWIASLFD